MFYTLEIQRDGEIVNNFKSNSNLIVLEKFKQVMIQYWEHKQKLTNYEKFSIKRALYDPNTYQIIQIMHFTNYEGKIFKYRYEYYFDLKEDSKNNV